MKQNLGQNCKIFLLHYHNSNFICELYSFEKKKKFVLRSLGLTFIIQ